MYKITSFGLINTETNACIPEEPLNADYRNYLAWVDAGGVPEDTREDEMKAACFQELAAQTTGYIYESNPLHVQINKLAAALQLFAPLLIDKLDASGQATANEFLAQYQHILDIRAKSKALAADISAGRLKDLGVIAEKIRE
jgi:hypothetical protein